MKIQQQFWNDYLLKSTAIRWWVDRFVHGNGAKKFILMTQGIIENDPEFSKRRERYAKYDLEFTEKELRLTIRSFRPAGKWATGHITYNPRKKTFDYSSETPPDLFGDDDDN